MSVSSRACLQIGTNFWNLAWGWGAEHYVTGGVWGNWDTTFIRQIQIYKCLRFMDWNFVNNSNHYTWATRIQKSQGCTQCTDMHKPIAFEWQIDLVNRVPGCAYWLNIMLYTDSTFNVNLGKLVRTQLNQGHKVFLEFGNETWWEGDNWRVTDSTAHTLGFPDNGAGPVVNGKSGIASYLGDAYLSSKVWHWFRLGWESAGGTRDQLVFVLTGPPDYGGGYYPADEAKYMLGALSNDRVNPTHEKCDAFAIAPYFTCNQPTALESVVGGMKDHYAVCQLYGIDLVTYEGGPGGVACDTVNMTAYLTMLSKYFTLYNQYTHTGMGWTSTGYVPGWGAAEAGYYPALASWSNTHNCGTATKEPYHIAKQDVSSQRAIFSLANISGVYGIDGRKIEPQSGKVVKSGCFIVASPGSGYNIQLNMK
jgi:hypothetical protein